MTEQQDDKKALGIWSTLSASVTEEAPAGTDIWTVVRDRLDRSKRRPRQSPVVEVAKHTTSKGETQYVLRNTCSDTYLMLDQHDFFLWELMDGRHSLRDMAVAYFAAHGAFPFERLSSLVDRLRANGLLDERSVNIFSAVGGHVHLPQPLQRLKHLADVLFRGEFVLPNADRLFGALYRRGGWIGFAPPAMIVQVMLVATGAVLLSWQWATGAHAAGQVAESDGIGLLSLLLFLGFGFLVHELGHALAVKHYGRKVRRCGALLHYGRPVPFVDTSDMWMAPRGARIVVSFAGPWVTAVLGGISAVVVATSSNPLVEGVFFQSAVVCYLAFLVNLVPFLELDGYYILMDWLEIPSLRTKALAFLRAGMWKQALRGWSEAGRAERIYATYGAMSVLAMVLFLMVGVHVWQTNVVQLVGTLQAGEDILAAVLTGGIGVLAGVPLAVGLAVRGFLFAERVLSYLRRRQQAA